MTDPHHADIDPHNLYTQLQDALAAHRDTRRQLTRLAREYALLNPADLAVDNLGEPTSPAYTLDGTRTALHDLIAHLYDSEDVFDRALAPASRLLRHRQ